MRHFHRRLRTVVIAAATALGLVGTTLVPAQALDITLNGQNINLDGTDLSKVASAVGALADQVNESANVSVQNTDGTTTTVVENENNKSNDIVVVILDPRSESEEPIGSEFSEKEKEITSKKETKPANVGKTADGRTVVFPTKGRFTSGYGMRWGRLHKGIDIANVIGTPIRSVMDGTVTAVGPAQGYGNWVVIQHDGGERSIYGHMAKWDVKVGQRVKAGDVIAYIGNEGRSTGPHLHFEIHPDGVTAVDPVPWFANQGISVHEARQ